MIRNDIIVSLMRAGMFVGPWELDDDAYDPISEGFVLQAWVAWVGSLPPQLVRQLELGGGKTMPCPKWLAECFDCDDIALDFGVFLTRCMAVSAVDKGAPRGNSASGRFNFQLGADPKRAHCRTWFINHDGEAKVFDAGDCTMAELSTEERPTIYFGESI